MPRDLCGPRSTRPACFTLVELLVVIVILAVLAAVGVSTLGRTSGGRQLEAAATRIQADLALARQQAIATGSPVTVQFDAASSRYVLPGVADPDKPGSDYTVDLASPPYEATIQAVRFGEDEEVIFDAFGRPDSAGLLEISGGGRRISLTVDADVGRVSIP